MPIRAATAVLLLLVAQALRHSACLAAPPSGWGEVAAQSPPSAHVQAVECLLGLNDLYKAGLSPEEIRARALQSGLGETVVQLYLDAVAGRRPVLYSSDRPEGYQPDPKLRDEALAAFGELIPRFSSMSPEQRSVGLLLVTARPELWEPTINLADNFRLLLPQGDLCASPAPTGDALYDRYALAVYTRIAEHRAKSAAGVKSNSNPVYELPAVPDELLAQWETDFGADPRYWELRFYCASARQRELRREPLLLAPGFHDPLDFLDEALRRGIARPATLIERFSYPYSQRRADREAREYAKAMASVMKDEIVPKPAPVQEYYDAAELAALHTARIAWPDLAWTHYLQACVFNKAEQPELAVAELKAGNACADKLYPFIFPLDVVLPAASQSPPGGAVVSGAIRSLDAAPIWWREARSLYRPVVAQADTAQDLALLEPIAEFVQGQCDLPISPLRSVDLIVMLTAAARAAEQWPAKALTPAQREMLQRQLAAKELLLQQSNAYFGWQDDAEAWLVLLTGTAQLEGTFAARYVGEELEDGVEVQGMPLVRLSVHSGYRGIEGNTELLAFEPLRSQDSKAFRWGGSRGRAIRVRAAELLGIEDPSKALEELFFPPGQKSEPAQ